MTRLEQILESIATGRADQWLLDSVSTEKEDSEDSSETVEEDQD